MSDDKFELSRRKILGATAAVGVAGAGAGVGTSALFSDEESFDGNQITAGELNLVVDYETSVSQDGVATGSTTGDGEADGDDSTLNGTGSITGEGAVQDVYSINDLKPGDSGSLKFCPKVVDNPGYLWIGSSGVTDYENGQTEPEADVDETGGGDLDNGSNNGAGAGELSEAIEVTVYYCAEDVEDPSDPTDPGDVRELNNPDDYSLADLILDLQTGFQLDGNEPNDGDSTVDPYPGSSDVDTQEGPCLCVEWELPLEVGNEIQSDGVEFDVIFAAIQSRNTGPTNPFVDITVGTGSAFDFNSVDAALESAGSGDVVGLAGETFTINSNSSIISSGDAAFDASIVPLGASRPTLEIDDGVQFRALNGPTIAGLDIDLNGGAKIYAPNPVDGLHFVDNDVWISATSPHGIRVEGAGDVNTLIAGNTFTQEIAYNGPDGAAQAILLSGGSGQTVYGNTITASSGVVDAGIAVWVVNDVSGETMSDIDIEANTIDSWEVAIGFNENPSDIEDVAIFDNNISGEDGSNPASDILEYQQSNVDDVTLTNNSGSFTSDL